MGLKVVHITYSQAPEDEPDRMTRAVGVGLRAAARHWHRNYAAKHFTSAGAREYGYKERTKKYMIRKARKLHHQLPLVWTGTLRSMVLGRFPEPRLKKENNSTRCTLALKVPTYTFYTKTKSGTPSPPKYDELVMTSEREAMDMEEIVATQSYMEINRPGRRKRMTVAA